MQTRSLLFVMLLIAAGVGVWTGVVYAGTEKGVWIERVLGGALIFFGAMMLLSRDSFNRASTQLHGAGVALMGLAWLMPLGWPRLGTLLVGLGFMVAAAVRRRRAATERPSS